MSHDNLAFTGSTDFTEMTSLDHGRKTHGDRTQNGSICQTPFSLDVNGKSVSPAVADVKMGATGGVYVIDIPGSRKTSKVAEEYEPHESRSVRRPITNSETLLHLLKGSLGTGILAMPNAFHHAGYAIGVAGTIFIGFICTYSIHLLVKSEYELCRRRRIPSLNYPDTASASMAEGPTLFQKCAPYAGHVVNIFLLIYQLGTCCVYVVFVSENIKEVVDEYYEPMDVRIYMVILLVPLILINWVRNLKFLAPFSTLANILTFIGFGITLYYIFTDIPSLADREPVGQIKHMPLFFGTVLFALEAIGVILPLENTMKSPKDFTKPCGVLNNAMILIITLYVGMGFFGYMKYGSGALGSITLNLSHTEKLAQSVRVMLAIAIFVTHALQCYVAVEIAWRNYLARRFEKHPYKLLLEYVTRTVLVLITFLLAVAIPNLELFISLFGALCLAALGIGFPAIIETATFWYTKCGSDFGLMVARNTFLVLFSLLGLIVGTYTSISDIIHTFT